MKQKIKAALSASIDYIEDNIHKPLSINDIYIVTGMSKYHFQRTFKKYIKKNVMEYVHGRKLTQSLYDLMQTTDTLKTIATRYGYKYEVTYVRSFKATFGEFRKGPTSYRISRFTNNKLDWTKSEYATPKADISLL